VTGWASTPYTAAGWIIGVTVVLIGVYLAAVVAARMLPARRPPADPRAGRCGTAAGRVTTSRVPSVARGPVASSTYGRDGDATILLLPAAVPPQGGGQHRAGRPIPPRTLAGRPDPHSRLESAVAAAPRRAGWPPLCGGAAAATPQAPARAVAHTGDARMARHRPGRDQDQTVVLTRLRAQQTETWTRPAGLTTGR